MYYAMLVNILLSLFGGWGGGDTAWIAAYHMDLF